MAFGQTNNVVPLFLQGPVGTGVPLTVVAPQPSSGVSTLFTQGPEANNVTLFIGKEIDASGIASLYLEAPFASGAAGAALEQKLTTLSVLGDLFFEKNQEATLSIAGPSIGSGVGTSTLFVEVDPPSADGIESAFNLATIFVSGTDPAGVGEGRNEVTTLFIRFEENQSGVMPLLIERAAPDFIPLSIATQISSGVIPLAVSGLLSEQGTTTLHITPPSTKTLTTVVRGFLE